MTTTSASPPVWAVDVTVSSHDHLKRGILAHPAVPGGPTWHRILVGDVAGDWEAVLVASQMASCTGGMCTSAELVSWPTDFEEQQ